MDHDSDFRRPDPDTIDIHPAPRGARRKPATHGRPEIADPLGDFSEQTGAWF